MFVVWWKAENEDLEAKFETQQEAQDYVKGLLESGVDSDDINVWEPDKFKPETCDFICDAWNGEPFAFHYS